MSLANALAEFDQSTFDSLSIPTLDGLIGAAYANPQGRQYADAISRMLFAAALANGIIELDAESKASLRVTPSQGITGSGVEDGVCDDSNAQVSIQPASGEVWEVQAMAFHTETSASGVVDVHVWDNTANRGSYLGSYTASLGRSVFSFPAGLTLTQNLFIKLVPTGITGGTSTMELAYIQTGE